MKTDKGDWKVKQSIPAGHRGARRMFERFGEDLLCVRYRYDGNGNRITTAEIIIDRAKIRPKNPPVDLPTLEGLGKKQSREVLRNLGYRPGMPEKEKALIITKARKLVQLLGKVKE